MSKLGAEDLKDIKETIAHTGEFRVHLIRSKSNLTLKCRMWRYDGRVIGVANGGGYDKAGAALGQGVELLFAEELQALKPGYEYVKVEGGARAGSMEGGKVKEGLYGLTRLQDGKMSLDGSCGIESVCAVIRALGFTVGIYSTGTGSDMVIARRKA
jgi:hypothetical protein